MSEPIGCTIDVSTPSEWADRMAVMFDDVLDGCTSYDDGTIQWAGPGNYGLHDSRVRDLLEWLESHAVPYRAASDAWCEFPGVLVVYDGVRALDGLVSGDLVVIDRAGCEAIGNGDSPFRYVEEYFSTMESTELDSSHLEGLPFPVDDEEED